jgi:hypothetical protein
MMFQIAAAERRAAQFVLLLTCVLAAFPWRTAQCGEGGNLRDRLGAATVLRGDAYYSTTDRICAEKDADKALAAVEGDDQAAPAVRILASILKARVGHPKEFASAQKLARSLRRTAREEMAQDEAGKQQSRAQEQQKAAEEEAARERWKKEAGDKLRQLEVDKTTQLRTVAGKERQVKKVEDDKFWIRAADDRRPWDQWAKEELTDEMAVVVYVYTTKSAVAFFSGELAGAGVGLGKRPFRDRTKGQDAYPLPKDVSALRSETGRLAALEIILASCPWKDWEEGNRDERAKATVADQVAVLKVLASGDVPDDGLVTVLSAKADEQATGRKPAFHHYWTGAKYSVLEYLARLKARNAVPALIRLLAVEEKEGSGTSFLRFAVAESLATIGGPEAKRRATESRPPDIEPLFSL